MNMSNMSDMVGTLDSWPKACCSVGFRKLAPGAIFASVMLGSADLSSLCAATFFITWLLGSIWVDKLDRLMVKPKLKANMPLRWMLLIYCTVYVLTWLLFTLWWQYAANDCENRQLTFRRAFMLSLETGMGFDGWPPWV